MKSPYSSWCREARLLPLFIPLMLVACSDGDSPTGGAGDASTTLSVYLTDAPGDVSRVWLEISSITTTGSGGTVELLTQPTDLIEVTALTDEAVALVQALDFDPGSVQTLRFVIGGAVLETNDGKVFTRNGALHPEGIESGGELQCPSCSQSGIKVRLSKVLTVAEGENGVLLDFDVSRSFGRQVGNSGRWVMSPVVHGASKNPNEVELGLSDLEIRGSIVLAAGVQIPVCAGAQRSLADFVPVAVATTLVDDTGEPVSFNGKSDGEGEVEIEVLEGDTYTLSFAEVVEFESGSLSFSGRVTPAQVNVGEDNPTVVGVIFTIESVSCAEAAPAPAMVTVLLIDAPGDVSRVWVDPFERDVTLVEDLAAQPA